MAAATKALMSPVTSMPSTINGNFGNDISPSDAMEFNRSRCNLCIGDDDLRASCIIIGRLLDSDSTRVTLLDSHHYFGSLSRSRSRSRSRTAEEDLDALLDHASAAAGGGEGGVETKALTLTTASLLHRSAAISDRNDDDDDDDGDHEKGRHRWCGC